MKISKEHMNIYKEYEKVVNKSIRQKKKIEFINKPYLKKDDFILIKEDEIIEMKKDRFKFENEDIYIGKLTDNNMDGQGIYIYNNEKLLTYVGDFNENTKHGIGFEEYANGNIYIGEFSDGLIHGVGKMTYKSEDVYIGNWVKNKKSGNGLYIWKLGGIYIGDFLEGRMEGSGTCYDENYSILYEGEWKNNLIHGYGKYIWNEGKWYEGDFLNGKKHGRGKFYLNNELVYDGTWKFDKPCIFNRGLEEIFSIKI